MRCITGIYIYNRDRKKSTACLKIYLRRAQKQKQKGVPNSLAQHITYKKEERGERAKYSHSTIYPEMERNWTYIRPRELSFKLIFMHYIASLT